MATLTAHICQLLSLIRDPYKELRRILLDCFSLDLVEQRSCLLLLRSPLKLVVPNFLQGHSLPVKFPSALLALPSVAVAPCLAMAVLEDPFWEVAF